MCRADGGPFPRGQARSHVASNSTRQDSLDPCLFGHAPFEVCVCARARAVWRGGSCDTRAMFGAGFRESMRHGVEYYVLRTLESELRTLRPCGVARCSGNRTNNFRFRDEYE